MLAVHTLCIGIGCPAWQWVLAVADFPKPGTGLKALKGAEQRPVTVVMATCKMMLAVSLTTLRCLAVVLQRTASTMPLLRTRPIIITGGKPNGTSISNDVGEERLTVVMIMMLMRTMILMMMMMHVMSMMLMMKMRLMSMLMMMMTIMMIMLMMIAVVVVMLMMMKLMMTWMTMVIMTISMIVVMVMVMMIMILR